MQSMDWNNGFARKAGKYFIVIPHEVNEIGGNILNTITVEELAQNGTEGLQLIDVRPENDFSHGAIEGAVNLPLEKIEAGETAILKKDQPVYLYCHVGENSCDAAEILEDDGFTTVNLEGGYRAWLRYQLTRVTMEDDSRKERTEQIEKSLIKKFRKPIWSRFTKALHDYEMIKDGDKIAVCISGGKDSMLLAKLFQELYRHGKRNFGLVFLCMNPGYNEENWRIIQKNAKLLDIPLTTFETQIFDSAVDAGFTFGFCFRLFLMILLLVYYPKLKKKNLIMLNMAFLFLCSNMAFNSVLVMRDRISILFSMGIVCIMPYLIAVLCHSKAKVFIVGLLFTFMFAQVYVQHNNPAAKYENVLWGISDKTRAKIRIFEESFKAIDR